MHPLTRRVAAALLMLAALSGRTAPIGPADSQVGAAESPAFISSVMQAGMLEIEASQMAVNASTSSTVKAFADRMIVDHQKLGTELAAIATKRGILIPEKLDQAHAKVMQALRDKLLKEFDAAYVAQMVRDHAQLVELLRSNANVADTELAAFVARALPVLQEHERLTGELEQSL